jgi:hypothetical protein
MASYKYLLFTLKLTATTLRTDWLSNSRMTSLRWLGRRTDGTIRVLTIPSFVSSSIDILTEQKWCKWIRSLKTRLSSCYWCRLSWVALSETRSRDCKGEVYAWGTWDGQRNNHASLFRLRKTITHRIMPFSRMCRRRFERMCRPGQKKYTRARKYYTVANRLNYSSKSTEWEPWEGGGGL